MSSEPTDPCIDFQPQLAAYALGETEAADELLDHLAVCASCQRDLRAYIQVARMLPYDAPDVAPPPALRARIIEAIEEAAPARAPAPAGPSPTQRPRWRLPSLRPGFAFALAVLIALLGWNISLQSQLSAQSAQIGANRESWQTMIVLLNDPAVRWYKVNGGAAWGNVWAAPQGQIACLVAQGLPQLAPGQVYQVWLMHGGERDSGGVFEAREGNGWVLIRSAEPLSNYDTVNVTVEPRGGSASPSGTPVLQGPIAAAHAPTAAERQGALALVTRP